MRPVDSTASLVHPFPHSAPKSIYAVPPRRSKPVFHRTGIPLGHSLPAPRLGHVHKPVFFLDVLRIKPSTRSRNFSRSPFSLIASKVMIIHSSPIPIRHLFALSGTLARGTRPSSTIRRTTSAPQQSSCAASQEDRAKRSKRSTLS